LSHSKSVSNNSFFLTIQRKFKTLENNLDLIKPKYKVKRGLIDGLGSIIKTITGNMDHDDYININGHIEALKTGEHDLEDRINNQIEINEKMIERFNSISQHINVQQENLGNYLDTLKNKVNNINEILILNQYLYQMNFDIDTLKEHLKDISESITLAKLQIISKNILHTTELEYINNRLIKQNIKLKSDQSIYEFLELQAFYSESNIIFAINIPILDPDTFSFFHLKELPINNSFLINLESPYLLINDYYHQFINEPCQTIEQMRYCKKSQLRKNKAHECIPKIISNDKAKCQLIKGNIEDEISIVEPGYILVTTTTEIKFNTNCKSIGEKLLKGTFLIHFNNCSVELNNITYFNTIPTFCDSIEVISTLLTEIHHSTILHKPTMEKLTNWTLENSKSIKIIDYHAKNNNSFFFTWIGLIVLTVISIIIWIVIFHKNKTLKQKNIPLELVTTYSKCVNTKAVNNSQIPQIQPDEQQQQKIYQMKFDHLQQQNQPQTLFDNPQQKQQKTKNFLWPSLH